MHFDVGAGCRSQPEMQARVVAGKIAALAHHFLRLDMSAVTNQHARADGAAVALRPHEPDLDPVVSGGGVVAQQRRRLILIHHQDVEIAVVVEVAKSAAAAHVASIDRGSGIFAQFEKMPIRQIAKDDGGTFGGKTCVNPL